MASPSEMIGWECGACTYTNDDCTRRDCPMCTMERPKRCFVVTELPRNTMGKVQKNLLRDQYKTLFSA